MSIAHNPYIKPTLRSAPPIPRITTMSRPRIRVSTNARMIMANLAVALLFIIAATAVLSMGSIPGVFNGADLLAIIFAGSSIMPVCRAWRRYKAGSSKGRVA